MPAKEKEAYGGGLGAPAEHAEEVTPHDTNELTYVSRAIWVGGGGDVTLVMSDGTEVTLVGVPSGTLLPVRARQVMSTGTTATSIVSLY